MLVANAGPLTLKSIHEHVQCEEKMVMARDSLDAAIEQQQCRSELFENDKLWGLEAEDEYKVVQDSRQRLTFIQYASFEGSARQPHKAVVDKLKDINFARFVIATFQRHADIPTANLFARGVYANANTGRWETESALRGFEQSHAHSQWCTLPRPADFKSDVTEFLSEFQIKNVELKLRKTYTQLF